MTPRKTGATAGSRRSRALRRMLAHGASVVRDPWVLLVSALGAGAGWAVQLPLGAALGIGAGMVAAAGVARGLSTEGADHVGAAAPSPLRRGTDQARLVERLERSAERLREMVPSFAGTSLGSPVVEASTGAASAVESARRLAAAVDAIDEVLTGAGAGGTGDRQATSAQAREAQRERKAVVLRLQARRAHLLSRIEAAYLSAEEVRVRLLEVAAAMEDPNVDPATDSGLAAVSENLEQLRRGLDELRSTADSGTPELGG